MNNLETVRAEFERAFGDYTFVADGHYYLYKGERVGIGATTFLHKFTNYFDAKKIAPMSAKKLGITTEEVLEQWAYKRDFSCDKGTTCHEYNQSLWSGEKWELLPFDNSPEYVEAVNKIKQQADNFYNDYKDKYIHFKDEQVIGSAEYDIASAVDHLFICKETGDLIIADYKTNTVLKGYNCGEENAWWVKQMKVPLSHLKDLAFNTYKLQLSLYKYIIETYTTLKVARLEIVYMSEEQDNYEIIQIPYLEQEVKNILNTRRRKNMNSVPILLIGKSGSGKSTSLRNFKKEEIAFINILGKPLPFKSEINAVKIDDYSTILHNINKTEKKIIVIDDAGYLITNEFMAKTSQKGYDKFTEIANNYFNLINGIKNLDGGKTVYLVMHEDNDDNGNIKPKTIGRMLDEKVNIEGMFTVCIRTMFDSGKYLFRLKTNGQDCVKTPFDMFTEVEMENDLKAFDKVVREYYDLDKKEMKKKENE